jgi:hypothetical protein
MIPHDHGCSHDCPRTRRTGSNIARTLEWYASRDACEYALEGSNTQSGIVGNATFSALRLASGPPAEYTFKFDAGDGVEATTVSNVVSKVARVEVTGPNNYNVSSRPQRRFVRTSRGFERLARGARASVACLHQAAMCCRDRSRATARPRHERPRLAAGGAHRHCLLVQDVHVLCAVRITAWRAAPTGS